MAETTMTRSELASLGGRGKALKQAVEQRVLLDAVLPDDLTLKSEADAQRLLELATDLTFRSYLSAGQAGAISKAIETWRKVEEQRLGRERMLQLEAQVAALRQELRAARKRGGSSARPEPDAGA